MQFSILQWNIWYKEDIHHIVAFLKEHPADVICLQELMRNSPLQSVVDTSEFIADTLGYQYHRQEMDVLIETKKDWKQANAIFSRFPFISKTSGWINESTGTHHFDDQDRAYVEATIDIKGTPVTIGTTHMSYTDFLESTPRKEQEATNLVEFLKKHKDKFLFTGDLNAPPESKIMERITSVLRDISPDGNTWTTKPFSYNGFETNELNWRLDYILATPDVRVVSAEVLKTEYSDHLPILATVEV
jgi:endonuclease/exonuclease/phosphatase family metal-dependent hydrolase